MVLAFEAKDWDKPPIGWVAEYNAPGPDAGFETHSAAVMRNARRILKQGGHLGCDFCCGAFEAITWTESQVEQAERDRQAVHD